MIQTFKGFLVFGWCSGNRSWRARWEDPPAEAGLAEGPSDCHFTTALDAGRVKKVAALFLKPSNRTVGTFIPTKAPERAPLPAQPDVVSMVKTYKGQESLAQGEEFQATVANIEARTERSSLPNGRVLIPQELDGSRGRTVFEAVHRQRDATIYWHLDDRYLGETHTFHQQSLDIDPGQHILTLVDNEGQRVTRRFEVLATRH